MKEKHQAIVVDLDGTLIDSDMLVENFFLFLRLYPWRVFHVLLWLLRGKAHLKRRLADAALPDVSTLPYNRGLVAWLRTQRAQGRRLVLATASDRRIAERVAAHVGLFDEVLGTDNVNLASGAKRAVLVERYGEKGYEYVGNAAADLAVWASASVIHVANPGWGVLDKARRLGEIGEVFDERPPRFRTLLKALRVHQWAKNALVFVPLLASHRFLEWPLLCKGIVAFVAFGACASSVYLLNDLLDLPDDRRHPSKRHRPLAAGTLSIVSALFLIPALLVGAFVLAGAVLPLGFVAALGAYYLLTLAYSTYLKRQVMVDVIALATLYTMRVVAGAQAVAVSATVWMLAFCIFLFLSLAFVKRYTELRDTLRRGGGRQEKLAGRGYFPEDFALLASLGGASGYLSVLVLALYIDDVAASTLYHSPQWMWGACLLLLFWLSRIWLIAHRGTMHEDPVVFALRDRVSHLTACLFVLIFLLASLA
jgi:4-hydroxybenzoate polyprenyltransferase/phosphoserine phosphatase